MKKVGKKDLKESRSSGQGLESGANGGEESSDLDDLGVGPSNVANHQAAANALSKPRWKNK